MAEAVVENRPPPVRFFCHKCNIEFEHVLQDYTCPFCAMGFIEKLEEGEGEGERQREEGGRGARVHVRTSHPHPHSHPRRRGDDPVDVDMTVLDDSSEDAMQDSPHFVNLSDFAFLLHNAQSGSGLNNPPAGGGPPRESRLLQLVQQVVLGGEAGGPLVVLGGRGMGGGLEGALGGEYVMSGEGLDAIMSQLLWQAESEGPPPLPAQAIASLPEVVISTEQVRQGLQCSICWETFLTEEKVRELSCGHLYHQGCITPWLSLHATCPICRKSLAPPAPSTPTHSQEPPGGAGPPPSLAFLFRACGLPSPPTTSSPTSNTDTTTTTTTSGAPPGPTQQPRGSMSELLNQLVSMSGALALNFTMGGGPPTVTATSAPAGGTSSQNPRPPPPPTNYDSDMDFD